MKLSTTLPPRLVLPLMIFVGVLMVGLRTGDIWNTLANDKPFHSITPAKAAEETAKKEPASTKAPAASTEKTAAAPETAKEKHPPSTPEGDLYRQLLGRREQLDKRASDLDARDAVLKIAEERIDQKMKELESLKGQIQTLLGQASAEQQQQIENLVKIYETMKPKEAARIFETLEMPVLLGVIQRMKPARTASVMAEMDPQKAKEITVALTKRDQLPTTK